MADATIERDAVRAFLLTPAAEVLLMRLAPAGMAPFWVAPGGGLEPGETPQEALRRELREEVGRDGLAIGPLLWRRRHTYSWYGRRLCQNELYFAVHVDRFEPRMDDPVEARIVDGFRWWRLCDLPAAAERLTPLSLAGIIGGYLRDGPPRGLPDVEVLVD